MENSTEERIAAALAIDDRQSRLDRLHELRREIPAEAFSALMSLMDSSGEKIRRRAAHALNRYRDLIPQRADVLATHLEHDNDPEVRLACTILLMEVRSQAVDLAYAHAIGDPDEKVVTLACNEMGYRGGAAGIKALFKVLANSPPKVRLLASIALIRQEAANEKVVATLEELRPSPVVAEFFKEDPDMKEFLEAIGASADRETFESLLAKARSQANAASRTKK